MSEESHHNDAVELDAPSGAERPDRKAAESYKDLPAVEYGAAADPLAFEDLPSSPIQQEVLFDGVTGERIQPIQPEPSIREPEPAIPLSEPEHRQEPDVWAAADPKPFEPPFVPVAYTPESYDDTVRQNGLAYSAGIAFFGSVAFTLFLGWIVDVLLGSSPWGIVGGIIMGSIIGFVQFFSITSRIFPKKDAGPAVSPLSDAAEKSDTDVL